MNNRNIFIEYLVELKSAYGKENQSLGNYLGGEVGSTEQRPFDKERRQQTKIQVLEYQKAQLEAALSNPDIKPSVLEDSIQSITREIENEKKASKNKQLGDLVTSRIQEDALQLQEFAKTILLPFTSEKNKTNSVNAIIEKFESFTHDLKEQLFNTIQLENDDDTQSENNQKTLRLCRAIEDCCRSYLFNVITTASAGSRELNWLFINRVATIFGRYSDPNHPNVAEAFDLNFQKLAFDQNMLAIINNDSPDKWHKHLQVFGEEAFKNYLVIISADREDYENFKTKVKTRLKEAISDTKRFSADDIKAFEKINVIAEELMPETRARALAVVQSDLRPLFWKKLAIAPESPSATQSQSQQRQNDNAETTPSTLSGPGK